MENEEIMVSILCLAYNHENYIADALESFINQKTNFRFEVIVNDDCSTDNTAKIIRQFQKKYPNIIKPIFQTENQYSQGKRMIIDILAPKAKGKYFALCEGDDYWTDKEKLQTQINFLEKNQNFSLCIHNSFKVDYNKKNIGEILPVIENRELSCEDFIKGGGAFIATNSIVAPIKYVIKCPKYFDDFSLDYMWQIYLSSMGKTYCFAKKMSAYRTGTGISWTDRMLQEPKKLANFYDKLIKKMKEIDEELEFKYHKTFTNKIIELQFNNYYLLDDFEKMKIEPYVSYKKTLPVYVRIKIFFKSKFPKIFYILRNMKVQKKEISKRDTN